MKETKNTEPMNAETMNAETMNAETMNAETMNAETMSPEREKARRILRARLPRLSEAGLNFEKRTGNFFRASLEKITEKTQDAAGNEVDKLDKNGSPVYVTDPATGAPVEKVCRRVVDIETETGELLPEFADLEAEISAKRAASVVVSNEQVAVKLRKAYDDAVAELEKAKEAIEIQTGTYDLAVNYVMAFELPEVTPRITVSAKMAAIEDENAKLRAKLIAAGIDPDEL